MLYHGRDTQFCAGDPAGGRNVKPLAPNNVYAFRVECRTGLSRADKRYKSVFSSEERVFRMPKTVPANIAPPRLDENAAATPTMLPIFWAAPITDGGSTIVSYTLMGIKRADLLASDADEAPFVEYYRGSDMACRVGDRECPEAFATSRRQLAFEHPLEPGTEYGFRVVATNEQGDSEASKTLWARTPTDEEHAIQAAAGLTVDVQSLGGEGAAGRYEDERRMEGVSAEIASPTFHASPSGMVDLPRGWTEYWDPDSGECFYYNEETGENKWDKPPVEESGASGDGSSECRSPSKASSLTADITFRKRRFRFLHALTSSDAAQQDTRPFKVIVRRDHLVTDSFLRLRKATRRELVRQTLRVQYEGEPGIDSGGIGKDWFLTLSREMMGPQYCLFAPEANGYYTIDARSGILDEAEEYFRVFGRIMGKALRDQRMLDMPLCHGIYCKLLGSEPQLEHLAQIDPMLAKSLTWMLENDITGVIEDQTFSATVEEFGARREVPLVPHGSRIVVSESNKRKYVAAVVKWHFGGKFPRQLRALMEGFYELIPHDLVSPFGCSELEMLFNGCPSIDAESLQGGAGVNYTGGYCATSPTIALFWRVFDDLDDADRANLLRFTTGCSKMPLDGFPSGLPFTITRSEFGEDGLPTAHTCFNQLVLPPYTDEVTMRKKLFLAFENMEGFFLT